MKRVVLAGLLALSVVGCLPSFHHLKKAPFSPPTEYSVGGDSVSGAVVSWRDFFTDSLLLSLIDTALRNNQELALLQQEIIIAQSEVRARIGAYLPFVDVETEVGTERASQYTLMGRLHETASIVPPSPNPPLLGSYRVGFRASWELDIWQRLRRAKRAAFHRYLATVEGRRFAQTQLVAEIAATYYEWLAVHALIRTVEQMIAIQSKALSLVRQEKTAGRLTELAVQRFEAEVAKNQSLLQTFRQQEVNLRNQLYQLTGRFPWQLDLDSLAFERWQPPRIPLGTPEQLLSQRPDLRQVEQLLQAAHLDVQIAKAAFYPRLQLSAEAGTAAFRPLYWFSLPEALMQFISASALAPLLNRNELVAAYQAAHATHQAAIYAYEKTLLQAYLEVLTQYHAVQNFERGYLYKENQVQSLRRGVDILLQLFQNGRADYVEVLLTQRDYLEAAMERIEIRKAQMLSAINLYRALGGGWN